MAICATGSAQTYLGGSATLSGVVGMATSPYVPTAAQITFSPAAGHYTSTQNIALSTTIPSADLFYTGDGTAATIASTLYASAIPVSANTTLNVQAALPGTISQGINASSTGWKICTVNGGGSPLSQLCGGVGSIQPSAWTWSFGSTMTETVSTTASSSETQILYIYAGPACDNCTTIAQDKWVKAVGGSTIIANNELDMYQNDSSRSRLHMFGLQCNQQAGIMQWQIDNQQGSWQNTGITLGCPLSTSSYTHIVYEGHWINGDTGCTGGYGCNYYDALTINGTRFTLGVTLPAYTEAGWASVCGLQDQIDLTNTSQSGSNPTTGGRSIQSENVGCGFGSSATDSAAYTIP
jgi:Chitobiase/beta-hexosaminidase C-terminal domain